LKSKTRDEKRMSFLDHLEELRWRILKSLAVVILFSVIAYFFSEHLLSILTRPVPKDVQLIFTTPTGAFLVSIKVAIIFGILASLPVIFYQIWAFVAPGLIEKEIRLAVVVVVSATCCFLLGFAFAYFIILPFGLRFRYAIAVIFILAAILTPPDVITQLLLAAPLILLYEGSIWISAAVTGKRKQPVAEKEA
jgi:sec-independent protein translocase protein TatC